MNEEDLRMIFDDIHEQIYSQQNRQKVVDEINAENNLSPETSLGDHFASIMLSNIVLEREFLFQLILRLTKNQNQ